MFPMVKLVVIPKAGAPYVAVVVPLVVVVVVLAVVVVVVVVTCLAPCRPPNRPSSSHAHVQQKGWGAVPRQRTACSGTGRFRYASFVLL